MPDKEELPLHYRRYSAVSGSLIKKIPENAPLEDNAQPGNTQPAPPPKSAASPDQKMVKLRDKLDEKLDQVQVLTEFVKIAYDLEEYDQILKYSGRFLAIHPRDNGIRFNMGMVLLKIGDAKKAKIEFRKILQFNPRFQQARQILDKMRQEKSS